MGYTTDFEGSFNLNKPLTAAHKMFLEKFAGSRRMKRNPNLIESLRKNPNYRFSHEAVGLELGTEGQNFVDGDGHAGQDHDESIIEYNHEPHGQPGLWCQWVPTEDGMKIVWDGGEKFYHYIEWIKYLIEYYLKPWGYTLNGKVKWAGEDNSDMGIIVIKNNKVTTKIAKIVYEED